MAPSRQLLMWSVPSIAVLLGIFWFRKKREFAKSDPGGRERIKSLQEELAEALNAEAEAIRASPLGKAERAIIKSAPIDIVPNGPGSHRSSPLDLTDEEVDLEIEKIIRKKSLKNDKRMSISNDAQDLGANTNSYIERQMSNKAAATPHKFSPKTEVVCSNDANSMCFAKISNGLELIQKDNINANNSLTESTKNDSTVLHNTSGASAAVDAEELNNNIVEAVGVSENSTNRLSNATTTNRGVSERDSANHSPVDPLLASPSMCHFSDNHSEVGYALLLS